MLFRLLICPRVLRRLFGFGYHGICAFSPPAGDMPNALFDERLLVEQFDLGDRARVSRLIFVFATWPFLFVCYC